MTYLLESRERRRYRARKAIAVGHKLLGWSQPATILATGLGHFVVKFREFAGPRGLLSEVVGTELMRHLGLPVPKWEPIEFSGEFISNHPEIWWRRHKTDSGRAPGAGIHFGSRLVESSTGSPTLQRLPSKWIPEVRNRADFVGALLVDLWANNCDRRQCIYMRLADGTLQAVFIDHGHMFGGDAGTDETCPRRAFCCDPRVYDGVWTAPVIRQWMDAINRVSERTLAQILHKVPTEWACAADLAHARAHLMARRARLDGWIEETTAVLRAGRFVEFQNGVEAMAVAHSAND